MEKLISLKTSPEIYEVLDEIKGDLCVKAEAALAMECTSENLKEVKAIRTEIRKSFEELETQRKALKKAYNQPYDTFKALYDDVTKDIKEADAELASRIKQVTDAALLIREEELRLYFDEKLMSLGLIWLDWEQLDINIITSKTDKFYRETIDKQVESINQDFLSIGGMPSEHEIRVRFMKNLSLAQSIQEVKQMEQELAQAESYATTSEVVHQQQEAVLQQNQGLLAPEIQEEEQICTTQFRVTAKRSKLLALKSFLDDGGYIYE